MNKNDTKIVNKIMSAYDVDAVCDDGNVIVTCKNKNTCDDIQHFFGDTITSDGVRDGRITIFLGDTLIHDNN